MLTDLDLIDTAAAADLPGSAFARVVDTWTASGGYYFASRLVPLPAGRYTADVRADFAADVLSTNLEAVAWRDGAARFLARSALHLSAGMRERGRYALSFTVPEPTDVEVRGYVPAGLDGSVLRRVRVGRVGDAGDSRPDTTPGAPAGTPWPVDHVRHVVLGTTSVCNASCVHCPTNKPSTRHLPRGAMPMDLFTRLADGLRDTGLPVAGNISFGLFAEGLLDPHVAERAAYLKKVLPGVPVSVNSNGGPATAELAYRLGPVVDIFNFHVEGVSADVYESLMPPLKAAAVFPRIEQFIARCGKPVFVTCPVSRRNAGEALAVRDYWLARGAVEVQFAPFSGRCSDDLRYEELSLSPAYGDCREDVATDLIVDADGTVLACCNDFKREHPIGDATRETVAELLTNAARRDVYDRFQARRLAEFETCRKCRIDSLDGIRQLAG